MAKAVLLSVKPKYCEMSPSQEQMEAFHAKYVAHVNGVLDGSVQYQDVLDTLKEEYDLEIEFT